MKPYALFLLLVGVRPALAQEVEQYHLHGSPKALPVSYTPFNSIEVLDNRADTTRLYTIQNGRYPPLSVDLDTLARVALGQYMNGLLRGVKQGDARLLVRLERMGSPNTYHRGFFAFGASVYVQKGEDAYQLLLRVRKVYRNAWSTPLPVIESACRNLLEVAGVAYARAEGTPEPTTTKKDMYWLLKDTSGYAIAKTAKLRTLAEIDRNVRERWGEYPILQPVEVVSGTYPTFKDFRSNRLHPWTVRMQLDPRDSLYVPEDRTERHDWAVCDGYDFFLRLPNGKYVLLDREETGVYFYVPYPSPDMYALLSRSEDLYYAPMATVHYTDGPLIIPPLPTHRSGNGGGNVNAGTALLIAGALVGVVVAAVIIDHAVRKHKALVRGRQGDYRYCSVDMDSGDILYSNVAYPLQQ
jgi:hypothetical protein